MLIKIKNKEIKLIQKKLYKAKLNIFQNHDKLIF